MNNEQDIMSTLKYFYRQTSPEFKVRNVLWSWDVNMIDWRSDGHRLVSALKYFYRQISPVLSL